MASKPSTITTPHSQTVEAAKDVVFGSAAGIIGKFVEYPFDTIKVRLQSQPHSVPPIYHGPLDCFRQSVRREGLLGLYRGISAPLVGAAIETSSLFFSYRIAQEALQATVLSKDEPLPFSALLVCGATSGAFTSLLLTPIELIKCKMQVPTLTHQLGYQAPGPLTLVASIFRHHGLLGFWHGQLGTLIRETGGSAAWFGSYEGVSAIFRHFQRQDRNPVSRSHSHPHSTPTTTGLTPPPSPPAKNLPPLPIYQQLLAGASAGISYNFIFYPADTIKSRMQTADLTALKDRGRGHTHETFFSVGKQLWREHGVRGLYRGCGITVGRAAPSSAFIFAVYEGLRGYFG